MSCQIRLCSQFVDIMGTLNTWFIGQRNRNRRHVKTVFRVLSLSRISTAKHVQLI